RGETLAYLIREPLGGRIEAAHVEQALIGPVRLSPTLQMARAVEREVSGAERIVEREGNVRALRHPELRAVERQADRRVRAPWSLAAVPCGDVAKLTLEANARGASRVVEQLTHAGGERAVPHGARVVDERAIIRVPVAVHV